MSRLAKQFEKDLKGHQLYKQEASLSILFVIHFAKAWFKSYGYLPRYYDFDMISFIFCFIDKSFGAVFFSKDLYKRTTKITFEHFLAVQNSMQLKEMRDYEKSKSVIKKIYDNYPPQELQQLSKEGLLKVLNKILEHIPLMLATTVYSESLDEELLKKLYQQVRGSKKLLDKFIKVSSLISFESYASIFDKALLSYSDNKNAKEVQWIQCDYYSVPDIDSTPKLLSKIIKQRGGVLNIKRDMERLEQERQHNKKAISVFKKKLSGQSLRLFEFVQLTMQVRDLRKEYFQKMFTVLANIARELFKRQGLPEEDIVYAVTDELVSGEYKKEEFKEMLQQREAGAIVYINNDGWQMECGDTRKAQEEIFLLVEAGHRNDATKIKGSIAYPGLIRGRVSIISSKKDFRKFIPKSVLVTSMTRPEFLPIIKQAVAIITDEGGITCHAAIISRELKIPCIIGTKIATRVLKDGDMVEVDANKGIVKILKRK